MLLNGVIFEKKKVFASSGSASHYTTHIIIDGNNNLLVMIVVLAVSVCYSIKKWETDGKRLNNFLEIYMFYFRAIAQGCARAKGFFE